MTVVLPAVAVVAGVLAMGRASDELVRGASRLAYLLRLAPVVIGAIVIGFGTSAPEMLVSGIAALGGDSDVGVGNIIGSNIANLSLILGAAGLIVPIAIHAPVLRREAPLSLAAVLLFGVLLFRGLDTTSGVILAVALIGAVSWIMRGDESRGADELAAEVLEASDYDEISAGAEIVRTLLGLVFTVGGAWILVWGALELADEFGVSGGFIGLTLVAIGTSLPELVASLAAARAGQTELIVGNLLGSNLFNSLGVGALVALLGDADVLDGGLPRLENAIMMAVAVLAYVMMRSRGVFQRREGALLLGVFGAFLVVSYAIQ